MPHQGASRRAGRWGRAWALGLGAAVAVMAGPSGLAAADQSYCIHIDRSKVPALVNDLKLSVLANVGTCSSVSVTADGVAIPAVYPATAGTCLINTTGTDLVVTALNVTVAGTGAASKATLYNNWHWAYSLTLDDGRQTQVLNARPLLDAKGWRAGAAIVGSWVGSSSYYMTWAEVQALRAAGWGIYNHTWTHPDPVTCADFATEFGQDQTQFLAQLPGYHVTHIVYPYEASGSSSCAGFPPSFLISGEVGSGGVSYVDAALPNAYLVPRNGLYGIDPTANEAIAASAGNNSRPTWMITITHSVTAGSGAAEDAYSTNQACLTSLFNYLDSNFLSGGKKNLWFAPSGEVQDYLFTRDDAVLSSCAVASPSPSPTPRSSATATVTVTGTPTPTLTGSRSPSPTPSRSMTLTASPTVTALNSATATPSRSASATPSATPSTIRTASPSLTASATSSPTASSTPSLTATATATATATGAATAATTLTATLSLPASATASLTGSATPSPTASSTPSLTATATGTATAATTLTATLSPPASATASPIASEMPSSTASITPSLTATTTGTATATLSPLASAIPTVRPSASVTATPLSTLNPTPTLTALGLPSSSATPSASAEQQAGPLVIARLVLVPDPNPTRLMLLLDGSADEGEVTLWTVAFKRVLSLGTGPLARGWAVVPLPAAALRGLPNGAYYLTVSLGRGPARAAARPLRLLLEK